MELETSSDERLQKRLRFLLRAYIVSWILAYLAIFRSDAISALVAESMLGGLHKMSTVWILSFLIVIPILAVYLLYQRAMD